jgi:threonine 3-dehydrogenase
VLKRECRQLLARFAAEHGFDTRWAVIPGVLHSDPNWGAGTTEYALDAILCAVENRPFACPVPLSTRLPMIFAEDLIVGLLRMQGADQSDLHETERGYCLAGFSFAAEELFSLLRERYPSAEFAVAEAWPASHFAKTWPNSICARQAREDLDFQAKFGFRETVEAIAGAHGARQQRSRE